jgi:hypothetical protein
LPLGRFYVLKETVSKKNKGEKKRPNGKTAKINYAQKGKKTA